MIFKKAYRANIMELSIIEFKLYSILFDFVRPKYFTNYCQVGEQHKYNFPMCMHVRWKQIPCLFSSRKSAQCLCLVLLTFIQKNLEAFIAKLHHLNRLNHEVSTYFSSQQPSKSKDLKFYCDSEFSFVRINKSTITWKWKVKVLRDNVTNNEAICNLLVMELIHSYKQDFLEVGKKKKFLTSRTDWKFCVFGHVMWWIHPQPSLSLSLSS